MAPSANGSAMQVSNASQKLTLLVLAAIVSTWFAGERLLERSEREVQAGTRAPERAAIDQDPVDQDPVDQAPEATLEAPPDAPADGEPDPPATEPGSGHETDLALAAATDPGETDPRPALGPVRVRGSLRMGSTQPEATLVWSALESEADATLTLRSEGGLFALETPAGGLQRVRIEPQGLQDAQGPLVVERVLELPPAGSASVDLTLPTGRLEGQLLDAAGAPIEDAFVDLLGDTAGFGVGAGRSPLQRALTDAEGRFRFELLAPGRYAAACLWRGADEAAEVLDLRFAQSETVAVETAGVAEARVQLPPSTLAGHAARVRLLREGDAALGATVALRRADAAGLPPFPLGRADRAGELILPALAADRDFVLVARTDTGRAQRSFRPADGASDPTGVQAPIEIAVPTGGWLLLAPSRSGRPVAASIEVFAGEDDSAPLARADARDLEPLDGQLVLRLGPFTPGPYRVLARTEDGAEVERALLVGRTDGPQEIQAIELPAAPADEGAPLEQAAR